MSTYTPRFQPPTSRPSGKDSDMRLRATPDAHGDNPFESPYTKRQQDTQQIKNLSFWGNTDQDPGEEEWTDRQSPIPFILGMIILVVGCTLLWFLFQWASGDKSSAPPIISADTTPFKVRPENPGGMMIPHQDKLVYGRLSQGNPQPVERLLPPPEQPMAQAPSAPPPMPHYPMPNNMQSPYPQQQGPQQQGPHQPGYAPPQQSYPAPQQQPMPQPYQTSSYPPVPNQAAYPPPSYPQQPYPTPQAPYGQAAPQTPGVVHPPLPPTPAHMSDLQRASSVEGIKPASQTEEDDEEQTDTPDSAGVNELNQLIAKEAQVPLKHSEKKNTKLGKPAALDPSKHKVQIASLPSRAMAEQEMRRIHAQHGTLFSNKPWSIQKINLADRGTTHRLVVGSFQNRSSALAFCKKLRNEQIGCMVIPPASE